MSEIRHDIVYDQKDLIYHTRESGKISFLHQEFPITLNCRLLECGIVTRSEPLLATLAYPPPFCRILIFTSGRAQVIIDGQTQLLYPHTIYVFPAGLLFDITYELSTLCYIHVHYSDSFEYPIVGQINKMLILDQQVLANEILRNAQQRQIPMLIANLMTVGLYLLDSESDLLVNRVKMLENFSEIIAFFKKTPTREHTIDNLAKIYNISNAALSKRFYRKTGMVLKQFLLEHQFHKAQDLLLRNQLTIEEIAEDVGFATSQYFHRFFKNRTGCTPSEFRQIHAK